MLTSQRVSVGSTPVELTADVPTDQEYEIRVQRVNGPDVLVGGADLTASSGFLPGSVFTIRLQGEPLFAVVPPGGVGNAVVQIIAYSV